MRVNKGVLGVNDCGKVGIDILKRVIIGWNGKNDLDGLLVYW